jgi:hypothetical protein
MALAFAGLALTACDPVEAPDDNNVEVVEGGGSKHVDDEVVKED